MDALTETTVVQQAAAEDVQRLLDDGFERLRLERNYGDWFEVRRADDDGAYRAAYYDASANRQYEAATAWTVETTKDAVLDYFEGHWNWHALTDWLPGEYM